MNEQDLYRDRPTPGCLSRFEISQAAIGDLEPAKLEQVDQHLQTCQRCYTLVNTEREQAEQAAFQPVPQRLLETDESRQKGGSPWLFRWAMAGAAAALVAVLVVLALPRTGGEHGGKTRIKGALALQMTVRRQGEFIANNVPAEKMTGLRAGDEIRLKVGGTAGLSTVLRSCEALSCRTFFQGLTPAGGWLPTGLTATEGKSTLELVACTTDKDLEKMLETVGKKPFREVKGTECRARSWDVQVKP